MQSILKIYLGLLLGAAGWIPLKAQAVDFFKEDLNFFLTQDEFIVRGVYFFANNSGDPYKGKLWYPLPDSNVTDIKVYNEKFQKLACSLRNQGQGEWGAGIPLQIAPKDTTFIIVRYHQKVTDGRVRYIVTSTRRWKRPLKSAYFQLTLDRSVGSVGFSFRPQQKKKVNGGVFYSWQFTNFYPDEDFWIYFKDKDND